MKDLIKVLKTHNLSICSVESLTGGLFASSLTAVSGSSTVFLGSLVAYANSVKSDVLKIDQKVIDKYGVVSREVSELMAKGGQALFKSDVSVSFTGNAGPNVLENKEVGLVYSTIVVNDLVYNYCDKLSGRRNDIRIEIVSLAKSRLILIIEGKGGL